MRKNLATHEVEHTELFKRWKAIHAFRFLTEKTYPNGTEKIEERNFRQNVYVVCPREGRKLKVDVFCGHKS